MVVDINNIVVRSIVPTAFTIEWDSTQPGTSEILFSEDNSYNRATAKEKVSYFHITKIEGLTQGTTYNFKIKTAGIDGIETISSNQPLTKVDAYGNAVVNNTHSITTLSQVQYETAIKAQRQDKQLPKEYYVKTTGSNTLDGRSIGTAWQNLVYAVTKVDYGDTIYVMPGTWTNQREAVLSRSGINIAPITIKAYEPTQKPILSSNVANPAISTSVVVNRSETQLFSDISYWNVDGLIINGFWLAILLNHRANHINIDNCDFNNNSTAFYAYTNSHHIITKNLNISNSTWNAWWVQNTYVPTTGTHHILADNVHISNQGEHSFFDLHSNLDTTGTNLSYITLWDCSANDSLKQTYGQPPIYVHPQRGADKYISIVNFSAKNTHGEILQLEGVESLYVDNVIANKTLGIMMLTSYGTVTKPKYIKNVVIKNVNLSITPLSANHMYGPGGHGVYLTGNYPIDNVTLENFTIEGVWEGYLPISKQNTATTNLKLINFDNQCIAPEFNFTITQE